jgi:adenine/guanine phosphoribosyltransferase-like PRPP-binding protein
MIEITTGYFNRHRSRSFLSDAAHDLKDVVFDTLVGRGMSGVLAVTRLAPHFGKHALYIRKPSDNSHGCHLAEGELGSSWLFIDDFVATGSTFNAVENVINQLIADRWKKGEPYPVYAGAYLYEDRIFTSYKSDLRLGSRYALEEVIKARKKAAEGVQNGQ